MEALPQQLQQFQPSQQFQQALAQLNNGLVEAQQRAAKPITAQASLSEVMIPLFNLMSNYIKLSQLDTYRYFFSFCAYLHQQQQDAEDDNVIIAVDPDLADEVEGCTTAARENIDKAKTFIREVQDYLGDNKPLPYGELEPKTDEAKALKAKADANIELWQTLRETALRVLSALQESHEDLGIIAGNVNSAVYEPDEDEDEPEDEPEDEDEVALPAEGQPEAPGGDAYESVVG